MKIQVAGWPARGLPGAGHFWRSGCGSGRRLVWFGGNDIRSSVVGPKGAKLVRADDRLSGRDDDREMLH